MNKIVFPRFDVRGERYEQSDIESWFISDISTEIYDRLCKNVHAKTNAEQALLSRLKNSLPQILLMSPASMGGYAYHIDKLYGSILVHSPKRKRTNTDFGAELLEAFNYTEYRKTKLVELVAWLNVKTCPYCNMSYTLYAEEPHQLKRKIRVDKLARMQFDHFYDKMSYPMLSMSLYNLIPSCPVCNQGKSTLALPSVFHPYVSDIQSLFRFEVKEPLSLMTGAKQPDFVDVKLKWESKISEDDQKAFENTFHINALYSRHGDIVEETYAKAYLELYFINPNNFSYLNKDQANELYRLWYGNYMNPIDIHKRPLAKFVQDIRRQAQYPFI